MKKPEPVQQKTKTTISYKIGLEDGSTYHKSGYSQYHERLRLFEEGKLPAGEEVYGYDQAVEHIREIKNHEYEGRKIHAHDVFVIQVITETATAITQPL